MKKEWYIVANQTGARVFEHASKSSPMTLIHTMENPWGRDRNREFETDRPGRSILGRTSQRFATSPEHDPHDQVANAFAKELAAYVKKAEHEHRFEVLHFVAEPKFLGKIKNEIDKLRCEIDWMSKDLARLSDHEVVARLSPESIELMRNGGSR